MSLETPISLEFFQRHYIVTHLKGDAAHVLDQLEQQARECGEPISKLLAVFVASRYNRPYQDDRWYARDVPLDKCYSAHGDFRHFRPPPPSPDFKGQRYVDFLPNYRRDIELGSFPQSKEIRAPWSEMPEPVVQERESEAYYILDGQLRIARHWYHNVQNVKVFIYRGEFPEL